MLGQRFRNARQAKGLSQEHLAEGVCSRSYIAAIENGRITRPSAENLRALAERLGQPVSYFLPDEQESLMQRLEYLLNKAKAHMSLDESEAAQAIFLECENIYGQTSSSNTHGLYYEVLAEIERRGGAVLQSTASYLTSANAYLRAGLSEQAWKCKYTSAFHLYKTGHLDYSVSVALDALKIITGNVELMDELRRTHYLLGCCYAALASASTAQSHFSLAEEAGCQTTEIGIRSLIGKASCYGRQGDWPNALREAQKAVALADRHQFDQLRAEALIGASVSLVNMKQVDMARKIIEEIVGMPTVPAATKRKAYREVILALSDCLLTTAARPYELELERMLAEPSPETRSWERVKDEGALVKCGLLKDAQSVKEIVLSFSQSFISFMRYRDAAEVLTFGASVLSEQNKPQEAYTMMTSAYDLLNRKAE